MGLSTQTEIRGYVTDVTHLRIMVSTDRGVIVRWKAAAAISCIHRLN